MAVDRYVHMYIQVCLVAHTYINVYIVVNIYILFYKRNVKVNSIDKQHFFVKVSVQLGYTYIFLLSL